MIKATEINSVPFFQDFSWTYLTAALGKQTLILAGLGLTWGMIERKRFAYLLLLWTVLLFLIANFNALHIPGGGLINNASVEIMLFIPISILGGYFIDQIFMHWKDLIPKKLIIPYKGAIIILTVIVAYTGSKQLVTIINPITILSRNADLPAIEWIHDNIPENETIVINPFAWGYGLYAGSDGGFWISPLSGRSTLPPPVLYGLGSGSRRIKEQSQKVVNLSSNPISLWEFLSTNQLHYIYIGAKGGILSPEKLSSSDLFNISYHKDGVWIFTIKP
jgi:branched-subunit amino acid transport protein